MSGANLQLSEVLIFLRIECNTDFMSCAQNVELEYRPEYDLIELSLVSHNMASRSIMYITSVQFTHHAHPIDLPH